MNLRIFHYYEPFCVGWDAITGVCTAFDGGRLFAEALTVLLFVFYFWVIVKIGRFSPAVTSIFVLNFILSFAMSLEIFLSTFPDQTWYLNAVLPIRESMPFPHFPRNSTEFAAIIFALFPVPSIHFTYVIGLMNVIFTMLLFFFLDRQKALPPKSKWFFLLFPSFALYSSGSLRDPIIAILMVVSVYLFLKKRPILSIVVSFPLFYLKIQNFGMFILSVLIFLATSTSVFWPVRLLFLAAGTAGLVYFSGHFNWSEIERFRAWLYFVDHGSYDGYTPVNSFGSMLQFALLGLPNILVRPFPWEANGPFQLVQSAENLVLFGFVVYFLKESFKDRVFFWKSWFLNIYFYTSMSIYGLVVVNFGTAARYKFPFFVVYIVFMFWLQHEHRNLVRPEKKA